MSPIFAILLCVVGASLALPTTPAELPLAVPTPLKTTVTDLKTLVPVPNTLPLLNGGLNKPQLPLLPQGEKLDLDAAGFWGWGLGYGLGGYYGGYGYPYGGYYGRYGYPYYGGYAYGR